MVMGVLSLPWIHLIGIILCQFQTLRLYSKWHHISYIVHYLWPVLFEPRSNVVHRIGTRAPFGTQARICLRKFGAEGNTLLIHQQLRKQLTHCDWWRRSVCWTWMGEGGKEGERAREREREGEGGRERFGCVQFLLPGPEWWLSLSG